MANNERGLFIYRPVSPHSRHTLEKLQAKYSIVETFRPVTNLHLTLLQGKVLPDIHGEARDDIIASSPETAQESYDMKITSARFHPGSDRLSRFAIALLLDDEDGHYHSEHQVFRNLAARKSNRDPFIVSKPHVTIGYLRPDFALESVLKVAQELEGHTLSFDPAETNLGKVTRKQKPKSSSNLTDIPVRTVVPGSIPSGFIASLKSCD